MRFFDQLGLFSSHNLTVAMAGINVSSLGSGLTGSTFDWQSFVDQIVSIDSAPITRLQDEEATNTSNLSLFTALGTRLTGLQTASKALNSPDLFTGRTAATSTPNSSWSVTASSGASLGSYAIAVSQLATATRRNGAANIASGISATNDVSGLTLASMSTATAVTAGTFSINGAQVSIALTDSLNDVFQKINTATGGDVTASYDASSDKVTFHSASNAEIVLGAANDSSNFLSVMRLANRDVAGDVTSSGSLGTAKLNVPLASARLSKAFASPAVDGSGNGSFTINGTSIAYNVNTDSLSTIINRINASNAGVTAAYDSNADRMTLTNTATGDTGMTLSEAANGFLDAVGLNNGVAGITTDRGLNALFTVNGGPTQSSTSNSLDSSATGIAGLTINATTRDTQTVTVTSNTDAMKKAIQSFIDNYNSVQSYIDDQTKITVSNGAVTAAPLANNREIQDWAHTLRSMAFGALSGVSGTVQRLADLGIDFQGQENQLTIKDSGKLDSVLRNNPQSVQSFFTTGTTGFSAIMSNFMGSLLGSDGTGTDGLLSVQKNSLTSANSSIDSQIAAIQRQLDSEKSRLTEGFQAMQAAQENAKSMQTALLNAFGQKSS